MQIETAGATASVATIDTSVLDTPRAEAYFTNADRRILCGCRATLEMLGIPLPHWAERRPSGPKPGRAIAAAFRVDNPETLHEATMRRNREMSARLNGHTDTLAGVTPADHQMLRDAR